MKQVYNPHPYQIKIMEHELNVPRCGIWAGMGMGKTSATLTMLDTLYLSGESAPTLILAPKRVCVSTWPNEILKWEHLRHLELTPITGTIKEKLVAVKRDTSLYACNYQNIPWLVDYYGKNWPFKTIVADESTRLKSFRLKQGGTRARALSQVAHTKVKRFIELTGTPAPNGLIDLWGQIWMLDQGARLGRTYTAYKERYFKPTPDGYGLELVSEYAATEIYSRLKDICLTVDPADYFDLKAPLVHNIIVDLPGGSRDIYNQMRKDLIFQIENHTITAANAAVKSQKLLQIANGAAYLDPAVDDDSHPRARGYRIIHDAKIDALESIIAECAGENILVAYNFRSDLERLLKAFPQASYLDDTPEIEKRWNQGKIPILLAHPASAGHGLNLQEGGRILVFFGHNWSLENRLQIIERIGPMRQLQIGLDKPIWIYNIVANKTIDSAVISRVDDKKSVQDALLESMKY